MNEAEIPAQMRDQLPLLAAGLVIWCGSWPLIFRGAAARYEKVDL